MTGLLGSFDGHAALPGQDMLCTVVKLTDSLTELTKKEEIGQFMKMTLLSRLSYDRNQTHPVARSLPLSLASAKATFKVMTSLKPVTLFYMDPYSLNVMRCAERPHRWGCGAARPGMQGPDCCGVGWWGHIPPSRGTFLFSARIHLSIRNSCCMCSVYQTSCWGLVD